VEHLRRSDSALLLVVAALAAACGADGVGGPEQSSAGKSSTNTGGVAMVGSGGAGVTSGGVSGNPADSPGASGAAVVAGAGGGAQAVGGAQAAGGTQAAGGALSSAGTGAGGGAQQGGSGGTSATPMPAVTEMWVAPDGLDTNPGTEALPMKTVCDTASKTGACYKLCAGSYKCPATGATIWMKTGTYKPTVKIDIGATRPGVAGGVMNLFAAPGAHPIIDASGLPSDDPTKTGIALHLKGSYWHIKGIEILNAPHNCIKVEGGYNVIENVIVHHCGNTGITIGQYSGTDMSAGPGSNNTILNCDSYGNVGPNNQGEDADGFGAKEQAGKGNLFKGCRSWNNADDGYDFYGWGDPITVQDCWAFENAKMGAPGGDGNGFKLGKGPGGHTVTNGISAYNVKTAYTSNGADKLSTCVNCKACSNGSVTGSGDHGISGTIADMSPCVSLSQGEGPRNADGSLPSL